MQNILHDQDYGPKIREFLPQPVDRPICSPCYIKLSDQPITQPDVPYDTARCEDVCIGKWGPALRRLSLYLVGKIYDYLPTIVDVVWSRGLNLPNLDDFDLEIDLTSGGRRWRFQMSTADNSPGRRPWRVRLLTSSSPLTNKLQRRKYQV